eukprot:SAG31_NODE_3057_length_4736_cov_28.760190_7_plen_55_part_00
MPSLLGARRGSSRVAARGRRRRAARRGWLPDPYVNVLRAYVLRYRAPCRAGYIF